MKEMGPLEIPFVDQPFQEGVDQTQGKVELAGKFSLAVVPVPVNFSHEPEHMEVFFIHISQYSSIFM